MRKTYLNLALLMLLAASLAICGRVIERADKPAQQKQPAAHPYQVSSNQKAHLL